MKDFCLIRNRCVSMQIDSIQNIIHFLKTKACLNPFHTLILTSLTPKEWSFSSNKHVQFEENLFTNYVLFLVDRAGIFIVGCSVYGGMGTYEYELELLDDQTPSALPEKSDHGSQQR